MCNSPTCPGDDNAPSKWECRACYGVKYSDPDERREKFLDDIRTQKVTEACGRIIKSVKDIENLLKGKADMDKIAEGLIIGDDRLAEYKLRLILGLKPVTRGDELL